MYRFPYEVAYLPQTRLSYVNLPGLLNDGKRDRTARVSGFVGVQLGERCYLIFLRGGEPFQAAQLDPSCRRQVAVAEVVRIAGTESERGEGGQIGYYGAPEAQLQAMLATILNPPSPPGDGVDFSRPDQLFPTLRERRFSGVVEMADGGTLQYLVFQDGGYRAGYLCQRDPSVSVSDFVRSLFQTAGAGLRVALYPPLHGLPEQAGPGLVDLYRRIVGGVMRELSGPMGREGAQEAVRRAQQAVAARRPVVAGYELSDDGRVRGDPVATPQLLTEAVAEWVSTTLIAASDYHAVDPADIVERVARDSRFVLAEQGFFARLPWTLPF